MLQCMSPLLAQSRHRLLDCTCLLSGVKRTWPFGRSSVASHWQTSTLLLRTSRVRGVNSNEPLLQKVEGGKTMSNSPNQRMKIGDFLLRRLKEAGVRHLFGVPGDYNLELLQQLQDTGALKWIGTCSELNASYAADGYARLNGLGALLVTNGVGPVVPENLIRADSRHEVESAHHLT